MLYCLSGALYGARGKPTIDAFLSGYIVVLGHCMVRGVNPRDAFPYGYIVCLGHCMVRGVNPLETRFFQVILSVWGIVWCVG